MNRKAILDKISQLIVSFQAEVEANNRLNLTDINIHAENFLIPLLKLVYGLSTSHQAQPKKSRKLEMIF